MTSVHISLGRDDGTTKTAAKGVVEWEPTTRREDGTMVILERGFTVPLVAGEATVTVDPSGLTWCWRVTERTDSGGVVRYVSVPDSAVTVEYVDLPDVDPTTLVAWSPADPEAAYRAALAAKVDEPDAEGTAGQALTTDGAGGRTWTTIAGGVTSVDGQTGAVSLSSTYEAKRGADDYYVTGAEKAAIHTHPAVIAQGATAADARAAIGAGTSSLVIGTTPGTAKEGNYEPDLSGLVTLGTAQSITGVKTLTAPVNVAATPAPILSANLAPALGDWALAGGATWDGTSLTIPAGGTASCSIAGFAADQVVQWDLARTGGSGGDLTLAVGAASAAYSNSATTGTVVTAASGTLTCTIGGGTYAAVLTGITIRTLTRLTPALVPGATEVRAWGTNSAVGYAAQRSLTTGSSNNAVGHGAQYSLTTGSFNNAVGHAAQRSLTTGSSNSAVGTFAQYSLTTGSSNSAVGTFAQYSLTTGSYNNAMGYAQNSLTTGSYNNAVGHGAQYGLTTGSYNNAVGHDAQRNLTTGSSNNAVGHGAQRSPRGNPAWATTTASRQTSIGHESGQGSSAQSDDIVTIGYRAIAVGTGAVSLGSGANAAYAGSVALGMSTVTTATAQVAVGARDVEIQDSSKGVVLKSPDGTRYRVTVANGGALSVAAA